MSRPNPTRAAPGEWVLFAGLEGDKTARIGRASVGPASSRPLSLRSVREGLLPVVHSAFTNSGHMPFVRGDRLVVQVEGDGRQWDAHLVLIRSPLTKVLIAAQGILVPVGAMPPELPLVGCWEWEILLDSEGRPTVNRRTYWDKSLFKLYKISPEASAMRDGFWEVGVWQNEIISQTDQLRLSGLIRDGIKEGIKGLRSLTFDVTTGYGSEESGQSHLRLIGRIATENPAGKLLIQGVTYEAARDFHEDAWERDAARVDDVLRGLIDLSDETTCVADPNTYEVLMTSPGWRRAGYSRTASLIEMFAEQTQEIRSFIGDAAADFTPQTFDRPLEVFLSDGTQHKVLMKACGVRGSDGVSIDVTVRLKRLDSQ